MRKNDRAVESKALALVLQLESCYIYAQPVKDVPAYLEQCTMRKNILIFGHNYATQFIDIFNQYTRLFDKNKYEVTVVYLTGEFNEQVRTRTIAEQVVFLDMPKKDIRYLKGKAVRKMLELSRQKNFEIVICHRYKPSYIMMCVAQVHKIPALVSVMHELKTMTSIGRRLLIALLARKNMLFAGVSNAVRDDLRKSLFFMRKERIVTLYNMIDVEMTEPQFLSRNEARRVLNIQENDFVFGNIARLAPNKNQERLLHAFAQIAPQCPNAKLIIMGDGDLETCLMNLCQELKLQDRVKFTGFVANGFKYMPAFDSFVLPSTQEAFGRVLLEAMLAKKPVIAGRVHGIPEVLGATGKLINPKSIPEIAQAMLAAYQAPEEQRQLLGQITYERATQYFSIPNFLSQFWNIPLLASLGAT